ncbi:hypothetical protein Tco_0790043 [Tanacetum coccineum]
MPVELGSFDAIIGMDWLARYQMIIVYAEKIVCIPWGNETLIVHGGGSNRGNETRLNIISCTKTQKYFLKGCPIFLAHVTTKKAEGKSKEKRLEDVPIVRDFPDVFPEDLPLFPMSSSRDSDVKSFDSSIDVTFALGPKKLPYVVLTRITFIKSFKTSNNSIKSSESIIYRFVFGNNELFILLDQKIDLIIFDLTITLMGIMEMEPDIENMTLKKDFDFDKILDDLIGDENLRRIGQKKVQNGCVMMTHPRIRTMKTVENDDDGNIYDIWDITIEDVKLIRQFLTPNVPDKIDEVIQPLISQPIHTTPPNDDYVAPATKSILDKILEESRDEILNVTMVEEEDDVNPTKDIEELERLLAKDPQSHFTKIQVHSVITKPEPCIHTQPMSPLYGIFESYESSTKPYKVYREMKSLSRYGLKYQKP